MNVDRHKRVKNQPAKLMIVILLAQMAASCFMERSRDEVGGIEFSFRTDPTRPQANQEVKLQARISGLPADELEKVAVDFSYYTFENYRPGTSLTNVIAKPTGSAEYVATARFDTATDWKVVVRVRRPGAEPVMATFPVSVVGSQQ